MFAVPYYLFLWMKRINCWPSISTIWLLQFFSSFVLKGWIISGVLSRQTLIWDAPPCQRISRSSRLPSEGLWMCDCVWCIVIVPKWQTYIAGNNSNPFLALISVIIHSFFLHFRFFFSRIAYTLSWSTWTVGTLCTGYNKKANSKNRLRCKYLGFCVCLKLKKK